MLFRSVKLSRSPFDSSRDVEVTHQPVKWRESLYSAPGGNSLSRRRVTLTLLPRIFTVTLGLDWATSSHYFLRIEVAANTLPITPATSSQILRERQQASEAGDDVGVSGVALRAEDVASDVPLGSNSTPTLPEERDDGEGTRKELGV